MNPGLAEESVKVVGEAAKGLGPYGLVAILFNLIVLGGIFYLVHEASERMDRRTTEMMQHCFKQAQ